MNILRAIISLVMEMIRPDPCDKVCPLCKCRSTMLFDGVCQECAFAGKRLTRQ